MGWSNADEARVEQGVESQSRLNLQFDKESMLNQDPQTSYNPLVKAVWLGNIARNFVLKFSLKNVSHPTQNKEPEAYTKCKINLKIT